MIGRGLASHSIGLEQAIDYINDGSEIWALRVEDEIVAAAEVGGNGILRDLMGTDYLRKFRGLLGDIADFCVKPDIVASRYVTVEFADFLPPANRQDGPRWDEPRPLPPELLKEGRLGNGDSDTED
ncbi:MAG: hypothetical protein Q4G26_13440 [Paracoccus sp. (in: a-proteobacteria)]|nr:hypothetical protein [Paracoccus sp. (in: a-proteobacteria)]